MEFMYRLMVNKGRSIFAYSFSNQRLFTDNHADAVDAVVGPVSSLQCVLVSFFLSVKYYLNVNGTWKEMMCVILEGADARLLGVGISPQKKLGTGIALLNLAGILELTRIVPQSGWDCQKLVNWELGFELKINWELGLGTPPPHHDPHSRINPWSNIFRTI